jgi:hypothetical protein
MIFLFNLLRLKKRIHPGEIRLFVFPLQKIQVSTTTETQYSLRWKTDFFDKGKTLIKNTHLTGDMGITAKGQVAVMTGDSLGKGCTVFFAAWA